MKKIDVFPEDINRCLFGAWLSGFVAGEGTFVLTIRNTHNRNPRASFSIVLRIDDAEILHLIQAYWQCGRIYQIRRKKNPDAHNPEVKIEVYRHADLKTILIPHFEKYPLFAKKRRDFEIWKEGVDLVYEVNKRKRHHSGISGRWGRSQKWMPNEREKFQWLHDEIRRVRAINQAETIPRLKPAEEISNSLFKDEK